MHRCLRGDAQSIDMNKEWSSGALVQSQHMNIKDYNRK
jgi:hypothetical protein